MNIRKLKVHHRIILQFPDKNTDSPPETVSQESYMYSHCSNLGSRRNNEIAEENNNSGNTIYGAI